MKQKMFFSTIALLFSCLTAFATETFNQSDPLLVVVIMVKNEEAVIKQTLEMYCKSDTKHQIGYMVYDTGDEPWSLTMARAKELFDEYGITNYYILQEPFIDFSTSRNKALRLAEQKFPQAGFLLMPDAEWYLNDVQLLLNFCQEHLYETEFAAYLTQIFTADYDFYVPRLIRARSDAFFEGVVHECVQTDNRTTVGPQRVHFTYPEKPKGMEASKKRWLRDRDLLMREHLKNPADSRTLFYLAQTFDCLGDFEKADYYYTKRTGLRGFVEEDYMAHYRLGYLTERLLIAQKTDIAWTTILKHYLDAFLMRPNRAEPLVRVAAYYINHNIYDLAFMYAYLACQIPYPTDILFIEKDLYTLRYEIFAKAALHVGLEIPQRICMQALERNAQSVPLEKYLLAQAFAG